MTEDDPALILTARHLATVSTTSAIRSRVSAGELVRLRRGAYMPTDAWAPLTRDDQYRAIIHAAAANHLDDRVFSHRSAAALWGLPCLGPWGSNVHLLVPRASGGRSDPGVRRHALGINPDDVTSVDGLLVTSLARTLVDIAASEAPMWAIAAIDAALHIPLLGGSPAISKDDLLEQWERMQPFRGHARALRALHFAETASGSTSESASRVTIAILGFPAPELQCHFRIAGRDYWTDFGWEGGRLVGECDGDAKYRDPGILGGQDPAEVVLAEKRREDAIRSQVDGFQRWGSAEAFSPRALRPKLLALGLTPGRPRLRGR